MTFRQVYGVMFLIIALIMLFVPQGSISRFSVDIRALHPGIRMGMLVAGIGIMFLSVHLWTEWETPFLDITGSFSSELFGNSLRLHPMAAGAYMLGFWLLIPVAHSVGGAPLAAIAWISVGPIFEIVQAILVTVKTFGVSIFYTDFSYAAILFGIVLSIASLAYLTQILFSRADAAATLAS